MSAAPRPTSPPAHPRARGVTLVATLHQVDVALAHFPRIVGLRDGQLAFDLPAGEVTRERVLTRPANRVEMAVQRCKLTASVTLTVSGYVLEGPVYRAPVEVGLGVLADRDFTDSELDPCCSHSRAPTR